jgi:hypothetical protein
VASTRRHTGIIAKPRTGALKRVVPAVIFGGQREICGQQKKEIVRDSVQSNRNANKKIGIQKSKKVPGHQIGQKTAHCFRQI